MRKTSFGLGLAATIIAFVIALLMLLFGLSTFYMAEIHWDESNNQDNYKTSVLDDNSGFRADTDVDSFFNIFFDAIGVWLIVSSICLFIAVTLGIIGICITIRRQSIAAGVMLLIAAILSIPSLYGFHAFALFIPAGVLAFIKDKKEGKIDTQYETVKEEII